MNLKKTCHFAETSKVLNNFLGLFKPLEHTHLVFNEGHTMVEFYVASVSGKEAKKLSDEINSLFKKININFRFLYGYKFEVHKEGRYFPDIVCEWIRKKRKTKYWIISNFGDI